LRSSGRAFRLAVRGSGKHAACPRRARTAVFAGRQRRLLVDFGYWYCPDGRDEKQQRAFEQSEARPQALEGIFSTSARLGFRPSLDNLSQGASDGSVFAVAIAREARRYCERGLPSRAERFRRALAHEFGGALELNPADYRVDRLPGSGA